MIAAISTLPAEQLRSGRTSEPFTLARSLTDAAGLTSFTVHYEQLAPGCRACSPHSHTTLDELIVVLEGTPTAFVNGTPRSLAPGDFVVFRADARQVHWLANESAEQASWLRVASAAPDDEVQYVNTPAAAQTSRGPGAATSI